MKRENNSNTQRQNKKRSKKMTKIVSDDFRYAMVEGSKLSCQLLILLVGMVLFVPTLGWSWKLVRKYVDEK